jgi:hypothetical protein
MFLVRISAGVLAIMFRSPSVVDLTIMGKVVSALGWYRKKTFKLSLTGTPAHQYFVIILRTLFA